MTLKFPFLHLAPENVALKKIKTKKKLVYEYIFIFLSKKIFLNHEIFILI